MVDLVTLGRRLKEARANSGLTQEQAADSIGVPRTAMVHIEAGNRSINTVELSELAKLYGRAIADFFTEDQSGSEYLVALHRISRNWDDNHQKIVNKEVERWVSLCREGVQLEKLLGRETRPTPPAYDLPQPKNFAEAALQGEKIAEEERKRIGLYDAPIPDMADLLSLQGIWASGAEFPIEVEMSGLFLHQDALGFVILVNFSHPRGRKRFSYAHEYCHALLDRKAAVTITMRDNANDLIEKRANAFAGSFLMPRSGVELLLSSLNKGGASRRNIHVFDVATEKGIETEKRNSVSSQQISFADVALLASHFGVSFQAAIYRLIDLGFINRKQLKELLDNENSMEQYLNSVGKEMIEAVNGRNPNDRAIKRQLLPLVFEASLQQKISKDKFLDLTRMLEITNPEELFALVA